MAYNHDNDRDDAIAETLDRSRRIESRLTSFIRKAGFMTPATKPIWDSTDYSVTVPSKEIALDEVLNAIPAHATENIAVVFAGKTLCVIAL